MNPDAMRVLFQGDSITHAHRRPEEQNIAFQLGNGYAFIVAARLARDNPDRRLDFINRGVCGDTVFDLVQRWESDAVAFRPDVLSLLIGVNDTGSEVLGENRYDYAEFSRHYRELLSRLREANPDIRFVLLEPFLLRAGEVTEAWFEPLQRKQDAVREIAEESGAIYIPLQETFDQLSRDVAPAAFWAFDGIHPTHAGFQILADAWLDATVSLFRD